MPDLNSSLGLGLDRLEVARLDGAFLHGHALRFAFVLFDEFGVHGFRRVDGPPSIFAALALSRISMPAASPPLGTVTPSSRMPVSPWRMPTT